jgi:hypothetical protein
LLTQYLKEQTTDQEKVALIFAWGALNDLACLLQCTLIVIHLKVAEHHIVVVFMQVETTKPHIREISLRRIHGE